MSRRAALVVGGLLLASTLGGCASGGWLADAIDGAVIQGAPPGAMAEEPLRRDGAVHAAKVVMGPGDAASSGNPQRQSGWIVEDASPRQRPYTLDTGDRLRVFVYGQPNLSRLYTVDQSGNISVPLIGNIRARGLSTAGLEGAIRGRLAQGLVREPQVTVDVQQNRPFFILGEVRTPGAYPYVTGMTVEMAVAIAGGFGERANERKARLTRRSGTYSDVIDVPPDTELEPGDTIYVYERLF
jgi:polysaccharide export outer membrane protein